MERPKVDHIKMMLSPNEWIRWPVLPLINEAKPYLGIIVDTFVGSTEESLKFFPGRNMFVALRELDFQNATVANPEELYEAGWRVD